MRPSVPFLALIVAACATTRPEPPVAGWTLQASATAGAALTYGEVLRIACRRNPADLFVATDHLPDGPVTLQVGDERFALTDDSGPGVAASTAVPPALPAALMAGGAISLTQGVRRLGPYPAPDARTAAAFAIACRG